jgi:short-subunit dehydrogenase involved in D-alanine esterification of teichoic acids
MAVEEANAAGKDSGGSARAAVLNLGSLASVYNLMTELTAKYPSIHFLFNNAGSTSNYNLTKTDSKMTLEACTLHTWLQNT